MKLLLVCDGGIVERIQPGCCKVKPRSPIIVCMDDSVGNSVIAGDTVSYHSIMNE